MSSKFRTDYSGEGENLSFLSFSVPISLFAATAPCSIVFCVTFLTAGWCQKSLKNKKNIVLWSSEFIDCFVLLVMLVLTGLRFNSHSSSCLGGSVA